VTVSQIAGAVRLRKNQIGIQSALGTAVAATRAVPWRGVPVYDPNRTDPDVDVGSIDPIIAPYRTAPTVTWNPTGLVTANDIPIRYLAGLKGGVSPTGAVAKTWDFQVASLTSDVFDIFTDEFVDDTEATDAIIAYGGVIDSLEETMPDDLGPWTFSDNWVFAGAIARQNGTNSLTTDQSPTFFFGDDTDITMDTVAGSIGNTPLVDTLHGATVRVSNNLDLKRLANGSNTRNQLAGFGRGARVIELTLRFAKSAAAIAERATLDDDPTPSRYFQLRVTSAVNATTATPYLWTRKGAFRLFSAADGEIGGNATIDLTYRAYYDSTLGYAYRASVRNTQSTAAAA
jgi:hypothetical protein